jgi:hypothetical protein
VYYSAGVASMTAYGTAVVLPHEGAMWLVARLMLDTAGGLFGLYLVIGLVLSLVAAIVRFRGRSATLPLRTQK